MFSQASVIMSTVRILLECILVSLCSHSLLILSGGSRISPRRACQLPGGAPTYDFAIFSQKLHEIERIWAPGVGRGRVQNFTM